MTSGIPLADIEKQYIRDHLQDGPARIAFELGQEFSEINGGFRKRDTVKKYIKRLQTGPALVVEIPQELSRAAFEKGILPDQLKFIALRAILQRVKAPG